jgi:hypothetical protein
MLQWVHENFLISFCVWYCQCWWIFPLLIKRSHVNQLLYGWKCCQSIIEWKFLHTSENSKIHWIKISCIDICHLEHGRECHQASEWPVMPRRNFLIYAWHLVYPFIESSCVLSTAISMYLWPFLLGARFHLFYLKTFSLSFIMKLSVNTLLALLIFLGVEYYCVQCARTFSKDCLQDNYIYVCRLTWLDSQHFLPLTKS